MDRITHNFQLHLQLLHCLPGSPSAMSPREIIVKSSTSSVISDVRKLSKIRSLLFPKHSYGISRNFHNKLQLEYQIKIN